VNSFVLKQGKTKIVFILVRVTSLKHHKIRPTKPSKPLYSGIYYSIYGFYQLYA